MEGPHTWRGAGRFVAAGLLPDPVSRGLHVDHLPFRGSARIRTGFELANVEYDPFVPYANPEDQKRFARLHYQANKEIYKKRAAASSKRQTEKIRSFIRQVKDAPCFDCGTKYPYYVMQFDHRDGAKSFTIGNYSKGKISLDRVVEEISKCDVVCANCHAERTHQRRQSSGSEGT